MRNDGCGSGEPHGCDEGLCIYGCAATATAALPNGANITMHLCETHLRELQAKATERGIPVVDKRTMRRR